MAFINDYLTEEEKKRFEKYGLNYPAGSGKETLKLGDDGTNCKCTVDRIQQIYLFHTTNSFQGRELIKMIDYFSLVFEKDGKGYVAYFDLEAINNDKEYHKLWKMRGFDANLVKHLSDKEIVKYLKEALDVYGISGRKGNSKANIGFEF